MSVVHVDRGMAWGTVIGGFVANFLLGGLAKSYGMIMEAFEKVFHSGSALLFLAGGLIYTLMYCLSLLNHIISQRYGSRPVVIVGAIGSCLSLLIAAYAPNITVWVVAIGIGLGASLSCIYFTVFSVVGQCFRRYLGLANGISVAGVSVGQMAFPAILTYFRDTYGARGAAVVISGMCLHFIVTGVLMPRHIIDPDAPVASKKSSEKKSTTLKQQQQQQDSHRLGKPGRFSRLRKREQRLSRLSEQDQVKSPEDQITLTDTHNNPKNGMCHLHDSELDNLRCHAVQPKGDVPDPSDALQTSCPSNKKMSLSAKHVRRLQNVLLCVYIGGKIFGDIGDVSVSFVAPVHGSQLGFSPSMINQAIAFSGAVDLVARLGIGFLNDRPCCQGRRGLLLAFTWIVEGINALIFAQLSQLKEAVNGQVVEPSSNLVFWYFFCFGIHGVCSGTAMTQMIVVLSDYVGSARLPYSLAVTMVVLGLLISPGQYAVGYVADLTYEFTWSLRICFIILVLAGLILLLEFPTRCLLDGHSTQSSWNLLRESPVDTVDDSLAMGPVDNGVWAVHDTDSESEKFVPSKPILRTSGRRKRHSSQTSQLSLPGGIGPVPLLPSSLIESDSQHSNRSLVMRSSYNHESDSGDDERGPREMIETFESAGGDHA